jgi:hypothetical protein
MAENKVAIVTSFNRKLYDYYGKYFIKSWLRKSWPCDLYVYHEGWTPQIDCVMTGKDPDKITYRNTLELNSPNIQNFIERNDKKNVYSTVKGEPEKIIHGTDYRRDAIRFCYKAFSLTHAGLEFLEQKKYKRMFWIDADVEFINSPTEREIFENLLPRQFLVSYLGRPSYYSECGFVGYNLEHPSCGAFLQKFRDMYDKDLLFQEKEWHDSYVWDMVRTKFFTNEAVFNYVRKDFEHIRGHPWPHTYLANWMIHLKGKRRKDKRNIVANAMLVDKKDDDKS